MTDKYCVDCHKKIRKVSIRCKRCAKLQIDPKTIARDNNIVEFYHKQQKRSIKEIAKYFGLGRTTIHNILNRNGIKVTRHKYMFDESVFDNDSSEKYYVLGLLASDGTISKNRNSKFVEIGLNKRDEALLNDVRCFFKTNKPISFSKKDDCFKFTLFSDRLYDIVTSYGIEERKSLTLAIRKHIPDKFLIDFLRGYFDGDGCITGKADITFGATASVYFATQLKNMYNRLGFNVYIYKDTQDRKNTIYMVKKCGHDGLNILATLYSRGGLFSSRKYEKFLKLTRLTADELMMETAYNFSKRSTCIRRKVGCVTTNKEKTNIVSIGYNGQAKGGSNCCESSLQGKCGCVHAENNALLKGCGIIMYCTTSPCSMCAKLIINAGIKEVYYDLQYNIQKTVKVLNAAGIKCKRIQKKRYNWKLCIADTMIFQEE